MAGEVWGSGYVGRDVVRVWRPNASYGPFTFGSERSKMPHVGALIYRKSMGPSDSISLYESLVGDIALEFWNEILTGVEVRDTFVLNGTELLGAHVNDVRHLIERQPRLANDVVSLSATFDSEDMTWFMTTDWYITSVTVGVDPDTLP